jgi:hypothetical protein
VLFYSPGDGHWWLGTYANGQLNWALARDTTAFGKVSRYPFWTGNVIGSGHADILFYPEGDDNWWVGHFTGTQLNLTLAGNTSGFGHNIYDGRPFWTGNLTGSGQTDILFYSPEDGNWWVGHFTGTQLPPVSTALVDKVALTACRQGAWAPCPLSLPCLRVPPRMRPPPATRGEEWTDARNR